MKNIHILPTDKPSRLILQGSELVLSKYMEVNEGFSEFNQHIYITSDENTKVGEWTLNMDIKILVKSPHAMYNNPYFKKIILTTDQDLIKDGVQAIDDEFLNWFVNNPSCEEIEIVKDLFQVNQNNPVLKGSTALAEGYKIIIPKELKQETLEEAADTYVKLDSKKTPLYWMFNDTFKDGAKWQVEQQDQFAIKFGVWLSTNCLQDTSKDGWWQYQNTLLTTDECLTEFKYEHLNGNA